MEIDVVILEAVDAMLMALQLRFGVRDSLLRASL